MPHGDLQKEKATLRPAIIADKRGTGLPLADVDEMDLELAIRLQLVEEASRSIICHQILEDVLTDEEFAAAKRKVLGI